jgi:hypothetical protein
MANIAQYNTELKDEGLEDTGREMESVETVLDILTISWVMWASPMKKLYLDMKRIVYRLIFEEGMVILGAKAP